MCGYSIDMSLCRRRPGFPGSLTDLHRFRKTAHGHDGSSRIVMVRKTDQRTFASIQNGQEPKLETITRETVETFRGQRTECKITTEKKDCEDIIPPDLIGALNEINSRTPKKSVSTPKSTPRRTLSKKKSPMAEFQSECLKAHNEYRRKHGVPPLKLSKDMCKTAQEWANYLISKNRLEHSNHENYGENLYAFTTNSPNPSISGKEPVECWYSEVKNHKYGVEMNSLVSGHFTQVVWKDSRELGVAYAKAGGRIVVVANYDPPGNIIGQFATQVLPPGSPTTTNNNHNDHAMSNGSSITERMHKLALSSKQLVNGSSDKDKHNGTEGNFEADFLNAHNEYRKRHGVPLLKLDKKLCKYSQEWANHLAAKNTLEHRPNSNYGENIYCLYSSDPNHTINGNTPVDSWYEEVHKHPFGKEPNNLKSGHFTQVVWKSSESLGVGVAKNSHGRIFVVANYSPAGNFVGNYVENVPPPLRPLDLLNDCSPSTPSVVTNGINSVSASDSTFTQFALDGLKVHNEYRKKHGVPELRLSKELCEYAQEWADTCAKSGSMCHRANNPYGENIFCVYSSDFSHVPTARDAVQEWYNEVKKHRFDVETVNHGTLHFTQVIWKDSVELGFAMAKDNRGQHFVVANYSPRGNYIGQFVANVPRPKS